MDERGEIKVATGMNKSRKRRRNRKGEKVAIVKKKRRGGRAAGACKVDLRGGLREGSGSSRDAEETSG